MNRLLAAAMLSLALFACPKEAPSVNLGGSDSEKMDTIASKLEEYRTRSELTCDQTCDLKKSVCSLSGTACDIAVKNADNNDFQQRCVTAQEDCAKFSESCGSCK